MASFTISSCADVFPVGTSVGAYLAKYRRDGSSPTGSSVDTATVASSGSLTFDGLDNDTQYVAYAAVGGQHHYRNFGTDRARTRPVEIVGTPADGDTPVWSSDTGAWVSEDANVLVATRHGVLPGLGDVGPALEDLFDLAVSEGVPVYTPASDLTYNVGTAVGIPAGLVWIGEDKFRVSFKLAASFPSSHPFYNKVSSGFTKVTIRGIGFDGNASNQSGDQTTNGTPNELMFLSSASGTPGEDIVVEDCYFHDSYRLGLVFQNITRPVARNNVVRSNGRDGITFFDKCVRGGAINNIVELCNDDHIALNSENGLSEQMVVQGNVIKGPGSRGLGKGVRVLGGRGHAVIGNTIDSVAEDGILVADYQSYGVKNLVVADNVIRNTGNTGSASKVGIRVHAGYSTYHPSAYATIQDVNITNNVIADAGGNGIELRTDHADAELLRVKVRGNTVSGCAGEGITTTSGSSYTVSDCEIDGNTCYLNAGHGIYSNLGKGMKVTNNTALNNGTGGSNTTGVRVVNADVCLVHGNLAYETRSGGSRTQTIGIYINGSGATANFVGQNYSYNCATDWSYNNIGGLTAFDAMHGKSPAVQGTFTDIVSLATALTNKGVASDTTAATTPSIAAGAAAGTGPTIGITGTDFKGEITLTPGTTPTADAVLATVTLAATRTVASVVAIAPSNKAAAALSGTSQVHAPTPSTTAFTLRSGDAALVEGTTYKWTYTHV